MISWTLDFRPQLPTGEKSASINCCILEFIGAGYREPVRVPALVFPFSDTLILTPLRPPPPKSPGARLMAVQIDLCPVPHSITGSFGSLRLRGAPQQCTPFASAAVDAGACPLLSPRIMGSARIFT